MRYVNQPVIKSDAMALVTGKPVYMDDIAPRDCLVVKLLRSPHAHALIEDIFPWTRRFWCRASRQSSLIGTFPRSGLPWRGRPIRNPAPMTG